MKPMIDYRLFFLVSLLLLSCSTPNEENRSLSQGTRTGLDAISPENSVSITLDSLDKILLQVNPSKINERNISQVLQIPGNDGEIVMQGGVSGSKYFMSIDGQDKAYSVDPVVENGNVKLKLKLENNAEFIVTKYHVYIINSDQLTEVSGMMALGNRDLISESKKVLKIEYYYYDKVRYNYLIGDGAIALVDGASKSIVNSSLTFDITSICMQFKNAASFVGDSSLNHVIKNIKYTGGEISSFPVYPVRLPNFITLNCMKDTSILKLQLPYRVNDMMSPIAPLSQDYTLDTLLSGYSFKSIESSQYGHGMVGLYNFFMEPSSYTSDYKRIHFFGVFNYYLDQIPKHYILVNGSHPFYHISYVTFKDNKTRVCRYSNDIECSSKSTGPYTTYYKWIVFPALTSDNLSNYPQGYYLRFDDEYQIINGNIHIVTDNDLSKCYDDGRFEDSSSIDVGLTSLNQNNLTIQWSNTKYPSNISTNEFITTNGAALENTLWSLKSDTARKIYLSGGVVYKTRGSNWQKDVDFQTWKTSDFASIFKSDTGWALSATDALISKNGVNGDVHYESTTSGFLLKSQLYTVKFNGHICQRKIPNRISPAERCQRTVANRRYMGIPVQNYPIDISTYDDVDFEKCLFDAGLK